MSLYELTKAVLRVVTRPAFAVTVDGEDRVPRSGGLVVAANHRSYLDPPLLGTWFPRTIHYMAKRELFAIPIFGPLIAAVHAFPVDREKSDLGSVRRALRIIKDGGVVGIFPEGTRNIAGDARAKGGAVLLAALARCPLIPVALVGTQHAVRRLRGSRVRVVIGEPIAFQGSANKPTKAELTQWTDLVSKTISGLAEGS